MFKMEYCAQKLELDLYNHMPYLLAMAVAAVQLKWSCHFVQKHEEVVL